MDNFRRGFAAELLTKLSANAQESENADAYVATGAEAIDKKKGLGEPTQTPFGKSKLAPSALTSPMGMRGYTGEKVD